MSNLFSKDAKAERNTLGAQLYHDTWEARESTPNHAGADCVVSKAANPAGVRRSKIAAGWCQSKGNQDL